MHGLHAIKNLNTHQTIKGLENIRAKAIAAEKQNHPQAAVFRAQYNDLRAEVLPDLQRIGYVEPAEVSALNA